GRPVTPNAPGQVGWTLNASWVDQNIKVRVDGFDSTGMVYRGGCCVMNCNNADEIYAFHQGGSNVLRADGSVQYMKESIAAPMLVALISYMGGEVINEN
ncbi:MAG: DUF1559 domain-containing protein, partial [Gemmataceae bacterium]